ncbi:MAG TPA: DUF1467 family protein [Azospirillaceae bacterium]|nr:DUF1467 family protein [Azospirillaceae bacterium]HRQ80902.1 DUF1467 family protein [Azospirillaceae bacterium]
MGALTGILVFVIVWWVVLFAVLPWGVETEAAAPPGAPLSGMAESAPKAPRIAMKMLITTLISLGIWLAIYLVVAYSGFSFREWAKTM